MSKRQTAGLVGVPAGAGVTTARIDANGDIGAVDVAVDKALSYDWTYDYASPAPHQATQVGGRTMFYDNNGNLAGWQGEGGEETTRRGMFWDEENRLQQVNTAGRAVDLSL